MRVLKFTLIGLSDDDLRSRRDRKIGRAAVFVAVLAALWVLARPGMRLDPASQDFGEHQVGTSSEVASFVLENPSSEALTVDVQIEGDVSDFFMERSCTSIAPADKCELMVHFTPAAPGPRVARVVVSDASGRLSVGADLSGMGTSPPPDDGRPDDGTGTEDGGGTVPPPILRRIAFDPPTLSFREVPVGGQTERASVRIINRGDEAFPITARVSGAPAIRHLGETCASATLQADGSCRVDLEFVPGATGKHQARLSVTDDRQAVHAMTISGSVGEPRPAGGIVFSPNPVTFKAQATGTKSSQPITLANTSDQSFKASYAPLDASIAGDFSLAGACEGFFFLPGSKCQGSVEFHPRSGGARTGTASIRNDAGTVVGTLTLEGTGQLAGEMRVEPQQLDFSAPRPRDQRVIVFNEGDAPFVIGPLRLTPDDKAYYYDSPPCISQPLTSKARCEIGVHYQAGLAGTAQTRSADLVIAPDSMPPARVRLVWNRPLEPAVSAAPPSVSFGPVRYGSAATRDVTFVNTGGGAATNVVVGFMKDGIPFSILQNSCNNLPPNGQCAVTIMFRPTALGPTDATLTLWNAAALAMLTTVPVDGEGVRE